MLGLIIAFILNTIGFAKSKLSYTDTLVKFNLSDCERPDSIMYPPPEPENTTSAFVESGNDTNKNEEGAYNILGSQYYLN